MGFFTASLIAKTHFCHSNTAHGRIIFSDLFRSHRLHKQTCAEPKLPPPNHKPLKCLSEEKWNLIFMVCLCSHSALLATWVDWFLSHSKETEQVPTLGSSAWNTQFSQMETKLWQDLVFSVRTPVTLLFFKNKVYKNV